MTEINAGRMRPAFVVVFFFTNILMRLMGLRGGLRSPSRGVGGIRRLLQSDDLLEAELLGRWLARPPDSDGDPSEVRHRSAE